MFGEISPPVFNSAIFLHFLADWSFESKRVQETKKWVFGVGFGPNRKWDQARQGIYSVCLGSRSNRKWDQVQLNGSRSSLGLIFGMGFGPIENETKGGQGHISCPLAKWLGHASEPKRTSLVSRFNNSIIP